MNEAFSPEIEQYNISGQNSAIRKPKRNNEDDVNCILEILNSEGNKKFRSTDKKEVYEEGDENVEVYFSDPFANLNIVLEGATRVYAPFVVSRSTKHSDENTARVQGIVGVSKDTASYYHQTGFLDKERESHNLVKVAQTPYNIVQLDWVKHPDAKQNQIAAGVRQVLYEIYRKTAEVKEVSVDKDRIKTIATYENLDDLDPADKTTETLKEGEEQPGETIVEVKHRAVVMAYIDPENTESIRVANASGFVNIGKLYGAEVYQVDWIKLLKLIQKEVKLI